MTPRTLILWLHVLSGVTWIGACASLLLASLALSGQYPELRELVRRAAPGINRIGLFCAALIPITGLGNLAFAARAHGFVLSREFTGIVAAKIFLLSLMGWALWRAMGVGSGPTGAEGATPAEGDAAIRRLRNYYGAIAGGGAIALLLGLWLSGL